MKEGQQEISFDQLDLKTQVWAVLAAAKPDMGLRTLLAVLGFDKKKVGPDNLNLKRIKKRTLRQIKEYVAEYEELSLEEKSQFDEQYDTLGDNQIADYYLDLAGF